MGARVVAHGAEKELRALLVTESKRGGWAVDADAGPGLKLLAIGENRRDGQPVDRPKNRRERLRPDVTVGVAAEQIARHDVTRREFDIPARPPEREGAFNRVVRGSLRDHSYRFEHAVQGVSRIRDTEFRPLRLAQKQPNPPVRLFQSGPRR